MRTSWPSCLRIARPAVRRRASERLGTLPEAVPALARVVSSSPSANERRDAVWALTSKQPTVGARRCVPALADVDDTVRQAALHSISVRRDRDAVPSLIEILKKPSMFNRRAAAEALGRIGDKTAVPGLLGALAEPADRALEHSLTYALIEIADPESTALGLKSENKDVRRACLTALDQMGHGALAREGVLGALASKDARLKETAWWIAARHSDWAPQLAGNLRERLQSNTLEAAEKKELTQQLARLARASAIQKLLVEELTDPRASLAARRLSLEAMTQADLEDRADDLADRHRQIDDRLARFDGT